MASSFAPRPCSSRQRAPMPTHALSACWPSSAITLCRGLIADRRKIDVLVWQCTKFMVVCGPDKLEVGHVILLPTCYPCVFERTEPHRFSLYCLRAAPEPSGLGRPGRTRDAAARRPASQRADAHLSVCGGHVRQ